MFSSHVIIVRTNPNSVVVSEAQWRQSQYIFGVQHSTRSRQFQFFSHEGPCDRRQCSATGVSCAPIATVLEQGPFQRSCLGPRYSGFNSNQEGTFRKCKCLLVFLWTLSLFQWDHIASHFGGRRSVPFGNNNTDDQFEAELLLNYIRVTKQDHKMVSGQLFNQEQNT